MLVIDRERREFEDGFAYAEEESEALAPQLIWRAADFARWGKLPRPAGLVVEGAVSPEELRDLVGRVDLIVVQFLKFSDGRGFTLAHQLRQKLGYGGDLRAAGWVIPDQFAALMKVGFSSVEVSERHPVGQWGGKAEGGARQLLARLMS